MKKSIKRKRPVSVHKDRKGVAELITKLQEQIFAMEKKLDILINKSSEKPFEKNYSQNSSRHFSPSHRDNKGRQFNSHRDKAFTRVICADCSKECEIPFKPRTDRPVYCRECFSKHREGNSFNTNQDKRDFSREYRPDRKKFTRRENPLKNKKSSLSRRKQHT